ncbi:MAG: CinA family protein [Actinobacteria bacterium]|nr:CinA family protein [Actinomycetota bacterium]
MLKPWPWGGPALCVEAAVAVAGVAGPERQEDQPVGLVFGASFVAGHIISRRWRLDHGNAH